MGIDDGRFENEAREPRAVTVDVLGIPQDEAHATVSDGPDNSLCMEGDDLRASAHDRGRRR